MWGREGAAPAEPARPEPRPPPPFSGNGLLEGGLSTLPLAPISAVDKEDLPHVIERMRGRLRTKGALGKELWVATYVLMGLCYERELINHLLRGVISMEESTTYQAIVEEGLLKGAIQEAKKTLLHQGTKLFGSPGPKAAATLDTIDKLEKLDELLVRVLDVSSWEELLGLAQQRARRRKRTL